MGGSLLPAHVICESVISAIWASGVGCRPAWSGLDLWWAGGIQKHISKLGVASCIFRDIKGRALVYFHHNQHLQSPNYWS